MPACAGFASAREISKMHAELASPSAQSAAVMALPILALARFRRLMRYEGHDVDPARMCIDADYAYRCLAAAHTSNDERLRCAALQLFETYQRNTAVESVLH
jgi:hypothetical protein